MVLSCDRPAGWHANTSTPCPSLGRSGCEDPYVHHMQEACIQLKVPSEIEVRDMRWLQGCGRVGAPWTPESGGCMSTIDERQEGTSVIAALTAIPMYEPHTRVMR